MNEEPFDKENIRAMIREGQAMMNNKEKITLACVLVLSASGSIALIVLAYYLAKQSNLF
jgi:fluoride ion exporter CrcB/FEX